MGLQNVVSMFKVCGSPSNHSYTPTAFHKSHEADTICDTHKT